MVTRRRSSTGPANFAPLARNLVAVGRRFHGRGWVSATSGNFSAVERVRPLRLAITASSVHKGTLTSSQILLVDERANVVGRRGGVPSAETALHLEIIRRRDARAVLHTHSVWSTMLSTRHATRGMLQIDGYEMLKGLAGVTTHEHRANIPVVANDQNMSRLAHAVGNALEREPGAHALLLQGHGLYTWGSTLAEAERHVEVLEFLFETLVRTATLSPEV